MLTLALTLDEHADPATYVTYLSARLVAYSVAPAGALHFREEPAAHAVEGTRTTRWTLVHDGPPAFVEWVDERASVGVVWLAIGGETADVVQALDARLREDLGGVVTQRQALDEALAARTRAPLLHRAALAYAGRGEVPAELRAHVAWAARTSVRALVFAAATAAVLLKDDAIDASLRELAAERPALRDLLEAATRMGRPG